MTERIRFSLLGPLEIEVDGRPVRVSSGRQRAVLAMLLISPDRVVSVDALTETVWQGTPPATARNQIAICVTSLRKTFRAAGADDGLIETSHPGYILSSRNCRIDLKELGELIGRARLAAAHDDRAPEATELFEQALGLWRGQALDGLGGGRIDDTATELNELWLDVNEEYAALQLRLGWHRPVVARLTPLVREHPLREQARAHLMQAHHLAGRRAEALQLYRLGREALVEELGVEPGPALREMHRQVLQEEDGPGAAPRGKAPAVPAAPAVAALTAGASVPAQLPLPAAAFTGREPELATLDELLPGQDDKVLAVAVVSGVSGVGKSALALHWANRAARHFPDGQLFIDVHGYREDDQPLSPMTVLDQALRALGVSSAQIPAGLPERSALYRSVLSGRRLLIILDDVRSSTQIRPLLPGRGQCVVLVTSRDQLDELAGDYAAVHIPLKVLTPDEADRMLATVIGAERVATDPVSAARLVELCGRLPLALRIAAGRLATRPHWSLRQLTSRLEDRFSRLDVLSPNDGGVRAGFQLSYRELSPEAAQLYRRLGLLPVTTFTGWMGAAVLDVGVHRAEDLIEQLVDAQLLEVSTPGAGTLQSRFRIQELLRLFAWERAHVEDGEQEREDAVARAFGTLLTLADEAHRSLYGKGTLMPHRARHAVALPGTTVARLLADPIEWFESERTTVLGLTGHAAQNPALGHAWELIARTVPLFETRNYLDDWEQAARVSLEAARAAGDGLGAAVMLRSLGTLAITRRRYGDAEELLSQAMELLDGRSADGSGERALVLRNLALCARFKGDLDGAAHFCRSALDHFGHSDDLAERSHALGLLAQIELERGDTEAGIALTREAIRSGEAAGSVRGKAQNIYRLAEAYLRAGEMRSAEDSCREVVSLTRVQGDRLGEAYALRALGETQWRQDRPHEAEATLKEALAVAEEVADRFLQARTEVDLACAEATRRGAGAVSRLRRAREVFRGMDAGSWERRVGRALERVVVGEREGVVVEATVLARELAAR
ncbi:BTAD domain-containing putative transcriptional regulator [Streptomyces globisporus]|uniref:AfsR/SARP family transcriptional regulator n=1 Tax=Streptomyces globisporus TaxID=1908 RepID=UPI0036C6CF09